MIKAFHLMSAMLAATILNISTMASADVICRGRVQAVIVGTNGYLNVNWGFDWIYLCNVNADTASPSTVIGKETCKSIMSQAMTAMGTGKDFGSYHVGISSCTGLRGSDGWSVAFPAQFYIFN
jgi:hypothetical protein